jgi:hypothetical protein
MFEKVTSTTNSCSTGRLYWHRDRILYIETANMHYRGIRSFDTGSTSAEGLNLKLVIQSLSIQSIGIQSLGIRPLGFQSLGIKSLGTQSLEI